MTRPAAFVFPDNLAALATCRELGRAGIPTVLFSATPGPAARSRYATFVEAPDLYDQPEAWLEFVLHRASREPTRPVLFATEDAGLLVSDRHHARLVEHVRYPHAAPGIVPRILDKRSLYEAARHAGVRTPDFFTIDGRADVEKIDGTRSGWIAKPACRYWLDEHGRVRTFLHLTGGAKAMAGNLKDDAAAILAGGFPGMIQERIPGPFEELVSVGLCLDREGTVVSMFTARKHCEYPEPFGDGLVVEAISDPGVCEPALAVLGTLGYWGMCDVEFKRDPRDGRYKLLDANPRVWLWHGLGDACGAPMALTAYHLATDASPLPKAPERTANHPVWVSPRGTVAFLTRTYRPARHGWSLPLRLTVGALGTMLGNLRTFHDPLYLRPSAWLDLLSAFSRRMRAKAKSRVAKRD